MVNDLIGKPMSDIRKLSVVITPFLNKNPGNYLEIGVYNGISLCNIAHQNPSKKIYGIDPFISDGNTGEKIGTELSEVENNCNQNIKLFSNVVLYKMTSELFFNNLAAPLISLLDVCVVYIDGSHTEKDVIIDISLSIKLIGNKKGLIIIDDMTSPPVISGVENAMKIYPKKIKTVESIHYINCI